MSKPNTPKVPPAEPRNVVSGKMFFAQRVYFSVPHIRSAEFLARSCAEFERSYDGKFSRGKWDAHTALVTGSIFASVAFLEATINEFIADADPKTGIARRNLDPQIRTSLARLGTLKMSTLQKYQISLAVARREMFDPGILPHQDVALLIKLRNHLIHYEPEVHLSGDTEEQTTNELGRALRVKLGARLNPLFARTSNPFFPNKCLCYGCAKWAVDSSVEFTREFFKRMGMDFTLNQLHADLETTLPDSPPTPPISQRP